MHLRLKYGVTIAVVIMAVLFFGDFSKTISAQSYEEKLTDITNNADEAFNKMLGEKTNTCGTLDTQTMIRIWGETPNFMRFAANEDREELSQAAENFVDGILSAEQIDKLRKIAKEQAKKYAKTTSNTCLFFFSKEGNKEPSHLMDGMNLSVSYGESDNPTAIMEDVFGSMRSGVNQMNTGVSQTLSPKNSPEPVPEEVQQGMDAIVAGIKEMTEWETLTLEDSSRIGDKYKFIKSGFTPRAHEASLKLYETNRAMMEALAKGYENMGQTDEAREIRAALEKDKPPTNEPHLYVMAHQGNRYAIVNFHDETKHSQADQILQLALGADSNDVNGPTIESFEPTTVTAGVKDTSEALGKETGVVTYTRREDNFILLGKNLQGATLYTEKASLDGETPGIAFSNVTVSEDGTEVRGTMITLPQAAEGATTVTVQTAGGSTAHTDVQVAITGTQYFKRTFSTYDSVKFYGDWPDLMPNEKIERAAEAISYGIQKVQSKAAYDPLNIEMNFYEDSFWKGTALRERCGFLLTDREGSIEYKGCALFEDPVIHISTGKMNADKDLWEIVRLIVHESAHKLHFYYDGKSQAGTPPPNRFSDEWRPLVSTSSVQCRFLPYNKVTDAWSDGSRGSACGFIQPYGAFDVEKGLFIEDVGTFAEWNSVHRDDFKEFILTPEVTPEAMLNSVFKNKEQLLDKYGF